MNATLNVKKYLPEHWFMAGLVIVFGTAATVAAVYTLIVEIGIIRH